MKYDLHASLERIAQWRTGCVHAVRRGWARFVSRIPHIGGTLAALLLFVSGWLYFGVAQPPVFFPLETIITIPEGTTVREAGELLKREQVVRSALAFHFLVVTHRDSRQVIAGDYYFTDRLSLREVVERVTHGTYGLTPIRVTLPEGATTYRMAELLSAKLPKFDAVLFELLVADKEGYLYPDTYFFLPNITTSDVVAKLEATFYEKLATIEPAVASSGRPLHEIITMASLLEKEAHATEDRRTIAGILWHRLAIGMPLQVDAVFGFIERTDTFNPKFSDLETESAYNTYQHKGLPPGPIGSPSISSLEAAVTPIETDALFYLHGRDGVLRVARTYEEHLTNRRKYLD